MPGPDPEFDFDGRYRVERVGGRWVLIGPAFGPGGMPVCGSHEERPGEEVLAKYRDLADLFNRVAAAERERTGLHPGGRRG